MLTLAKDTVPVTAEKESVGRAEGGNAVCPRGAFPGLEAGALESQSGPPCICFCLLAARSPAKVWLPQSLQSWAFLYSGLLGEHRDFSPKESPGAPCPIQVPVFP